jgi:DNA polymerase-3 subunit beta
MKIVAERDALYRTLQQVGSVIASGHTQPLYRNVKIDATGDNNIYLSATDLEVGICLKNEHVEVEEPGSVLLVEERIAPILRATPDENISLEDDDGAVILKSSDGRFRILTENVEDFPDIPSPEGGSTIEVAPEVMEYMISRTEFAAAAEKGRYALNGVLVVMDEEGNLETVAANGVRLARVEKKANNPNGESIYSIVVRKGLHEIAKLAATSQEPLEIQVTDKQFIAKNPNGRVSCQLVEGQFPNYQEVIPEHCKYKVQLPTKVLANALRRASFMASEQSKAVDFNFSAGQLVLTSESPELGDAEIRMGVEYEGPDFQLSFNPEYIVDMLDAVERDVISVEFIDKASPCVFRSGNDYTYVVSPVIRE